MPRTWQQAATSAQAKRQLRIEVAVAVLVAAVGVTMVMWEYMFSVPTDRLVQVYRTHGCRCVFPWVRSLKAEGFIVELREYETLENVRRRLRTPAELHGCHVGAYDGYFVEGHVAPDVLRQVGQSHPPGIGLTTESALAGRSKHTGEDHARVLLVEASGNARAWPATGEAKGTVR